MNLIRACVLRNPAKLPRGFFKPRGFFGDFFHLGFLVFLQWMRDGKSRNLKHEKKGLQTHCLRGLYRCIFKNGPETLWPVNAGFVHFELSEHRVIGNRYAKTTAKSIASLVTEGQKSGGKACRHW